MTLSLLTEHHLEWLSLKEAVLARLSLHLSKCHIVGNHMSRLKSFRHAKLQRLARIFHFTYNKAFILSKNRITKALLLLRGCTGWNASLLSTSFSPHNYAMNLI